MVKPFSWEGLLARVRALFRRASTVGGLPDILPLGELEIDVEKHRVRQGKTIDQAAAEGIRTAAVPGSACGRRHSTSPIAASHLGANLRR